VNAPTGESLILGPWSPDPLNLDLSSLPGHGSHTIKITCALAPGATYAIDIAPEERFEEASEIETLLFTADRQEREWTYVATSPFRPGYRVRPNPGGEWSDPRSPSEPLVLQATEDV
jgi:hypothetical protein